MNHSPPREYGLPAIVGKDPTVLILGSFPSKMSLAAQLYYANPRNQFWRIMQRLVSLDDDQPTAENQDALKARHIAVWDMIASRAFQPGAMDHDIRDPVMNDIPAFLLKYPTICFIGVNGGKAMECFNSVSRDIPLPGRIIVMQLPSTSPAHATLSFAQKLYRWQMLLIYLSR